MRIRVYEYFKRILCMSDIQTQNLESVPTLLTYVNLICIIMVTSSSTSPSSSPFPYSYYHHHASSFLYLSFPTLYFFISTLPLFQGRLRR